MNQYFLNECNLAEIVEEFKTSEDVICELLFPMLSVGDRCTEKDDGVMNPQARMTLPQKLAGSSGLGCSANGKAMLASPCNLHQLLAEAREGMSVRGRDAMVHDKSCT